MLYVYEYDIAQRDMYKNWLSVLVRYLKLIYACRDCPIKFRIILRQYIVDSVNRMLVVCS